MEWGLTTNQAMLFSFIVTMPSWANREQINGRDFYRVAKNKIVTELPILTDKPDTVYRLMKQLESARLITIHPDKNNGICFALSEKCKSWFSNTHTDADPNNLGCRSEVGTDTDPTYHNTSNHNSLSNVREEYSNEGQQTEPQTYAMYDNWEPSQTFFEILKAYRIDQTKYDNDVLDSFKLHWTGQSGKIGSRNTWERKLADWVKKQRPQGGKNAGNKNTGKFGLSDFLDKFDD